MIYKQETIGLKEGTALVFILTTARVTWTSMAALVSRSGQASWIQMIFYTVGAVTVLSLIYSVYRMSGCKGDLHQLNQQVLGKLVGFVVTLAICLSSIGNSMFVLRLYAENTIITAMPHLDLEISVWLYAIIAATAVHFGLTGISCAARLFMPILIFTFLGLCLFIYPFWIPYRLFPWQGTGAVRAVTEGLTGVGYSMGAIISFVWAGFFPNIKTAYWSSVKGVVGSMILKILVIVVYILVFGIEVGSEKVMPFYEMARLIHLSRYFQNVESLLILAWVILGLLSLAISLYLVVYLCCRLFKIEDARPVLLLVTLTIGTLALLPEDFSKVNELDRLYIWQTAIINYGIPILLFIVQYWRQIRRQAWMG